MGNTLDTTLRQRDRIIGSLKSLASRATHSGITADQWNTESQTIFGQFPKLPYWAKAYCRGYQMALWDSFYRDHLIYGGFVAGVFFSTHSNRPDYYGKLGFSAQQWGEISDERGHYWQLADGRIVPWAAEINPDKKVA